MMKKKFVILVPKYLNMSPGKVASQVAHAVGKFAMTYPEFMKEHHKENQAKYVLGIGYEFSLQYWQEKLPKDVTVYKFFDRAPTTENTEGMATAAVVYGPRSLIDEAFSHLELY